MFRESALIYESKLVSKLKEYCEFAARFRVLMFEKYVTYN